MNDVVVGLRGHDIADAAAQLLRLTLPRRGFSASDVERMVNAVIARERELPTTCGSTAIPHARDASVGSFVAAVGTNRDGIVNGTSHPRAIIAFISPESRRNEHLAFLASLSRLATDSGVMDALGAAAKPEDVVALLKR